MERIASLCPKSLEEVYTEEIRQRSLKKTDLCDHLLTIFYETIQVKPNLIVELGVRAGESTWVLERAARLSGAALLSLDLRPTSFCSEYPGWFFVQADDLAFAKAFIPWAKAHGLPAEIDVLFVDTSHSYRHTLAEINSYFPYLKKNSKAIFHDTNLRLFGRYRDRSLCLGCFWHGGGVRRALEDFLGIKIDGNKDGELELIGWHLKHYSFCNGLTVLRKTY